MSRVGPRLAERLARELALARVEIRQGRFERSMALMTAFAAIVSGWEVYARHPRGAVSHWLMWTPVWVTPPMVAAGVGAAFSQRMATQVLRMISAVTCLDGLPGFGLHLQGIRRMTRPTRRDTSGAGAPGAQAGYVSSLAPWPHVLTRPGPQPSRWAELGAIVAWVLGRGYAPATPTRPGSSGPDASTRSRDSHV